jgi:multicomponent Na+:H+ antiporter subunit G
VNEAMDILGWICLSGGAILCVISAVGVLRFPDFYTRTHAASIADTMGAGLIILGMIFKVIPYMVGDDGSWQTDQWIALAKLVFLGVFILFTSPTAGHALVKAAHAHGVSWELGDAQPVAAAAAPAAAPEADAEEEAAEEEAEQAEEEDDAGGDDA